MHGMAEVMARLELAAAAMAGPAARQTETKVADNAAERMRQMAPSRTGALKRSIRSAHGEVVAEAPYAAFVEFGTSDTPSQPFFRPALHEAEQELPKTAQTIYRRVVPGLHA